MNKQELKQLLAAHKAWRRGEPGGTRANLCGVDLCRADLSGVNLSEADLYGVDLNGADLSDTVLDPQRDPDGADDTWERTSDGRCIGYRTRAAGHIGEYRDGRHYNADWFSVCPETECHPGLYLWPTIEQARDYAPHEPLIRVTSRPEDIQHAGTKARTRAFYVEGAVK